MSSIANDLQSDMNKVAPAPQYTCPAIDTILADALKHSKAMSSAIRFLRRVEGYDAMSELEAAETFADSLEEPLEALRRDNQRLRDRSESLEKILDDAITQVDALEDKEAELVNHAERGDTIIRWLTEQHTTAWWRRLMNHATAMVWRSRARALKEKNKDLRWEVYAAQSGRVLSSLQDFAAQVEAVKAGEPPCPIQVMASGSNAHKAYGWGRQGWDAAAALRVERDQAWKGTENWVATTREALGCGKDEGLRDRINSLRDQLAAITEDRRNIENILHDTLAERGRLLEKSFADGCLTGYRNAIHDLSNAGTKPIAFVSGGCEGWEKKVREQERERIIDLFDAPERSLAACEYEISTGKLVRLLGENLRTAMTPAEERTNG